MKDKNQLIGWILIAIVLFGWTWYSQKDAAQRHAEQVVRDSIENVRMIEQAKIEKEKAKKENAEKMAELADTLNPLHAARQIKETTSLHSQYQATEHSSRRLKSSTLTTRIRREATSYSLTATTTLSSSASTERAQTS